MLTADAWLQQLGRTYTPSPTQFDAASRKRAALQQRLEAAIGLDTMFEIGSLRHGTGIWLHSDADYLLALTGPRPSDPRSALQRVRAVVAQRYPSSSVGISRPAVVCTFTDAIIELVPGYRDGSAYWIPDPTGGWMRTYPAQHHRYINEVNDRHRGGVKRLARHLKIWKYARDAPLSSCYLEMRAARHLDTRSSYRPAADLARVLRHLDRVELAAMNDPTGLDCRFTACSSASNLTTALQKLHRAAERADRAHELTDRGQHIAAIATLTTLFDQ